MIWAALFAILFMSSGGGSFAAEVFSSDARAVVQEVVGDEVRRDEAVRIMKQGQKDLKSGLKRMSKVAKEFRKADENHMAGLEELNPTLEKLATERVLSQQAALDRLFELKQTMNEDEWNAIFDRLK